VSDDWATTRFSAFASLSDARLAELKELVGPLRALAKGEVIRQEGDTSQNMYLLCSGWTASSMAVSGGARQIIKVHMPGDLLGLPSLALDRAADTLSALTPVTLLTVEPRALGRLFEVSPHLSALLFLISQEERVMLMDRLASLGRTDATARLTALVLQLHARVKRNNPDAGPTFQVPLTQENLADLTGLTEVHVNRTIKKLRVNRVLRWSRQWITIVDEPELRRLAGLPERKLATDLTWMPADSE
jgi:CRP/FNR family transcriptional regulator